MLLTKRIVSCILILVRWIQRFEIKNARVAQLVEHDLAKVGAAGSSPVSCSIKITQNADKYSVLGVFCFSKFASKLHLKRIYAVSGCFQADFHLLNDSCVLRHQ